MKKSVFLIVHIKYTRLDLISKDFSNLVNPVIPLQGECFTLLKCLLVLCSFMGLYRHILSVKFSIQVLRQC